MNEENYNGATMTIDQEAIEIHMAEFANGLMKVSDDKYIVLYNDNLSGECRIH